jgi:type II secretory pathway pseudopilin PulG
MINKKRNSGITLIALVITIIVLLILAGVTIATLTGDNGLLTKASEAQKANIEATAREKIQIEVTGSYGLTGEIDIDSLNKNLSRINGLLYKENSLSSTNKITKLPAIVELDGYEFKIEGNGETGKLNYTSAEENYIGYYADVDADGTVDGVIFADLVAGSSKETQQYCDRSNGYGASYGLYTIPNSSTATGFKNYYISKESYTWANTEEGKPVLTPRGSGNDRFYIMSLNDFTTPAYTDSEDLSKNYPAYTTYYWYKNAYGKMSASDISVNFGTGKTNTETMISKWNANGGTGGYTDATQENQDLWKHIQTKFSEGWFIPSRAEWAAFANELGITTSNYNSIYGLTSNQYWSSSQRDTQWVWWAELLYGSMNYNGSVNVLKPVRLATTF